MEVSLEDAYGEACKALGEMVVRERLLLAELAKREQALAQLAAQLASPPAPEPTT